MKKIAVFIFFLSIASFFFSCKKRGCITEYAINFDATAKKDDKSCQYYKKLLVTSVKVPEFPILDPSGEEWDVGSLPDIYIRFTNEEDDIKFETQIIKEIGPDDTVVFDFPKTYPRIDTLSANTQFKLYEADDVSAELVEKFPVNFLDYMHESLSGKEKYPDSLILSGTNQDIWVYINWIE